MKTNQTGLSPLKTITACCFLAACLSSCVYIDDNLGQNFIPTSQQYDVYTMSFPLKDITMQYADSLSGFSSSRITVGAVRDPETGLTTRGSAFTLVPLEESMDFGENPEVTQFHFTAVRDTLSFPSEDEEKILQNIHIHELDKKLGSTYIYTSSGYEMAKDGIIGGSITDGTVIYSGGDSLSFDFSHDFSQRFLEGLAEKHSGLEDIDAYNEAFPGIYITADEPAGMGGRINMFGLTLQVNDSYYVTGNYAELKFRSTYNGTERDTSFLFYFGAQSLTYSSSVTQYSLNVCGHEEYSEAMDKPASVTDKITVEGGGGLKPVISAKEIRDRLHEHFADNNVNMDEVVINKASLIFPFDDPDYVLKDIYPTMLSPTIRLKSEVESDVEGEENRLSLYYAGLTDASVSSENQGNVNWSLGEYAPDITHHVQEIIKLDDDTDWSIRDIWLLILATETVTTNNDNSDMNEYLQNLAYYNYYNNLYGYGYGYGYGGYGGYGGYYDYNNYYNYYMMAAMMSNSSSQTTSSSAQLDKDRYYTCTLRGPEAPLEGEITENDKPELQRRPMVSVTYSVPKK